MDASCVTPSTQFNVFLSGLDPYPLTATRTNFYGYTENLCVSCVISPLGRVDGIYVGPNLPDFIKT